MMTSFFRYLLIWIGLISASIFLYGRFCDWFFTQQSFLDPVNNKRAWNLSHNNEQYDFIVLGNSRAYGAFDMPMLNKNLGLRGIGISNAP